MKCWNVFGTIGIALICMNPLAAQDRVLGPEDEPALMPPLSPALNDFLQMKPGTNGVFSEEAIAEGIAKVQAEFDDLAIKSEDLVAGKGYLANRKDKRVIVIGEASDMSAGEPIEFFITTRASGHAYEAIAVAACKPSGLHAGLEFIGSEAGSPVEMSKLRFWPRGPRIIVDLLHHRDGKLETVRIEDLAIDPKTQKTAPRTGFSFVGSKIIEDPSDPSKEAYAADVFSPKSILANFNLIETVLDLPRQAAKGDVYGQQVYAPKTRLIPLSPLAMVFREAENQALIELDLTVTGTRIDTLKFKLTDDEGNTVGNAGESFADLLSTFEGLSKKGHETHVNLRFDDTVELAAVNQTCNILKQINSPAGIRLGPPADGRLYFESFIPDESYRERIQRPEQPWELTLKADGTVVASDVQMRFPGGAPQPTITAKDIVIENPAAFRDLVAASPERSTLFVFAEPDADLGDLMKWIKPVHSKFGIFFIYLTKPKLPGAP